MSSRSHFTSMPFFSCLTSWIQPKHTLQVSLLKCGKGNARGCVPDACKGGSLLPLHSPGTGTVLQNSPPRQGIEPFEGGSALKWATHRCQTPEPTEPIYSQQSWGRKAAVAPGMTINQHEMPALAKWTLSKYLKSSKELWRGRELSGPVARQSKVRTQTRPLGGWGTAG